MTDRHNAKQVLVVDERQNCCRSYSMEKGVQKLDVELVVVENEIAHNARHAKTDPPDTDATFVSKHPQKRIGQDEKHTSATEIVEMVRSSGLNRIANRIAYLNELATNDLDGQCIDLESLRRFADFITQTRVPYPQIGIDADGYVHAEWRNEKSIFDIEFLPSGVADYVSGAPQQGHGSWPPNGALPVDQMVTLAQPLIAQLMASR